MPAFSVSWGLCGFLRQREDEYVRGIAWFQFRRNSQRRIRSQRWTGGNSHVLLASDRKRHRVTTDWGPEVGFPQYLPRLVIVRSEPAVDVATEYEPATRGDQRHRTRALFLLPDRLAGFGGDRPHGAHFVGARRKLCIHLDAVDF